MSTRRKFLKASLLSSGALLTGEKPIANASFKHYQLKDQPVVISTWDFGKTANAAAWEILKNKGRAIDAVEAGVRIP